MSDMARWMLVLVQKHQAQGPGAGALDIRRSQQRCNQPRDLLTQLEGTVSVVEAEQPAANVLPFKDMYGHTITCQLAQKVCGGRTADAAANDGNLRLATQCRRRRPC